MGELHPSKFLRVNFTLQKFYGWTLPFKNSKGELHPSKIIRVFTLRDRVRVKRSIKYYVSTCTRIYRRWPTRGQEPTGWLRTVRSLLVQAVKSLDDCSTRQEVNESPALIRSAVSRDDGGFVVVVLDKHTKSWHHVLCNFFLDLVGGFSAALLEFRRRKPKLKRRFCSWSSSDRATDPCNGWSGGPREDGSREDWRTLGLSFTSWRVKQSSKLFTACSSKDHAVLTRSVPDLVSVISYKCACTWTRNNWPFDPYPIAKGEGPYNFWGVKFTLRIFEGWSSPIGFLKGEVDP